MPSDNTLHDFAQQTCKTGQEASFSYIALLLEKGEETRTLSVSVGCKNLLKGYLQELEAGNWTLTATVYDKNYQPRFAAHSMLKVVAQKKLTTPLVFEDTSTGPLFINNRAPEYAVYESSFVSVPVLQPFPGNFASIVGSPDDYISAGQQYAYQGNEFSLSGFKNLLYLQTNEGYDDWTSSIALPYLKLEQESMRI
ncbi:hypothetical protein ACF3NA_00520 [Alkanindiges sp. WGS2144]|uniref:hypothetical protein n=1 Tax=Alkanindiges sp. WGS2144 TaxID=3366808 RepID=UPI003752AA5B